MICSAEWQMRFMVKSPDQSGRIRTLIHHGPSTGGNVSQKTKEFKRAKTNKKLIDKQLKNRIEGRSDGGCKYEKEIIPACEK